MGATETNFEAAENEPLETPDKKKAKKDNNDLSYKRSMSFSDVVFTAKKWGTPEERDVLCHLVSGRTSRSYISKDEKDPRNLYGGEDCQLPAGMDTLVARFSMRVNGNCRAPYGGASRAFAKKMSEVFDLLAPSIVPELAADFAAHIFNGSWAWRNNECISKRVKVSHDGSDIPEEVLAEMISKALLANAPFVIEVEGEFQMGSGQNVYPSQLMKAGGSKDDDKKREFYKVMRKDGKEVPAIRGVKVGNAVRTVDCWYEGHAGSEPIALEAHGSNMRWGEDLRKDKNSFFDYLDVVRTDNDRLDKVRAMPINAQKYFIGMLIRGGLFVTETK